MFILLTILIATFTGYVINKTVSNFAEYVSDMKKGSDVIGDVGWPLSLLLIFVGYMFWFFVGIGVFTTLSWFAGRIG